MRVLTLDEIAMVAGGDDCSSGGGRGGGRNNIGGVTDSGSFGQDLINIYEGAVAATSYVIERIVKALD